MGQVLGSDGAWNAAGGFPSRIPMNGPVNKLFTYSPEYLRLKDKITTFLNKKPKNCRSYALSNAEYDLIFSEEKRKVMARNIDNLTFYDFVFTLDNYDSTIFHTPPAGDAIIYLPDGNNDFGSLINYAIQGMAWAHAMEVHRAWRVIGRLDDVLAYLHNGFKRPEPFDADRTARAARWSDYGYHYYFGNSSTVDRITR
jgi:hypothetical protein